MARALKEQTPMTSKIFSAAVASDIARFFAEDDLSRNLFYTAQLPDEDVSCQLFCKSDLVIAGLPFFTEAFKYLSNSHTSPLSLNEESILRFEGQKISKSSSPAIEFTLPFSLALTGERIALNLLQHASSIATMARGFAEKAAPINIAILDTRKTTPGLRSLEKYAVRVGGGQNHRMGQSDQWMIKDNHKHFFGGIKGALQFFKSMGGFYNPIVVEIHSLEEMQEAIKLGITHVMLDNFKPSSIKEPVKIKPANITIELSGGIRLENIDQYLIQGVDAISVGALTYDAPSVDISLKYHRKGQSK